MGTSTSKINRNLEDNMYYIKTINYNGDYQCYNCCAITRSYKNEIKHKLNCKNQYKIPIFYNDRFIYKL